MLRACILDLGGKWEGHLPLVEFAYNNSFQTTFGMARYEALYGHRCRSQICSEEVGERRILGLELVERTIEAIDKIRPREGFQYRFQAWRFSGQFVSTGHIRTIIPLLILWFIWTARNDAKHRDIAMEPRRIIWRVYHTISLLHTGRLFRHIHWRGDMDIAPMFGVIITTPSHPPPTLVFWRTPPVGSYKINTDGCVKDRFASGGGIIKDSSGQCIRAFFSFYGDCTILEAELRAILDGIILAQRLGLSVLWVESDSTLAIHCITKGGGPWHIQATIRHIRHLLSLDRDTITHIYREGNQVADLLASEG
ncbi:Uncharacterized protein Adt_39240 [Abeliophyllum distichum]|uniref:RNase H type-1 domain-containing protein n=1 Tax=Abeliophyllum distichum TaxID=126358 RepID=A0ABD1Q5G2_9LAMI